MKQPQLVPRLAWGQGTGVDGALCHGTGLKMAPSDRPSSVRNGPASRWGAGCFGPGARGGGRRGMSLAAGGTVSRFTSFALILLALAACAPVDLAYGPWPVSLDRPPEGMSHEAWAHGLAANEQAREAGLTDRSLMAVIDYSRPATQRRLWVIDLAT